LARGDGIVFGPNIRGKQAPDQPAGETIPRPASSSRLAAVSF